MVDNLYSRFLVDLGELFEREEDTLSYIATPNKHAAEISSGNRCHHTRHKSK